MEALSDLNLAENYNDIIEFKHNGDEFKKSTKLRKFFNSVFSSNLVAVYSSNKDPSTDNGLDWSGDSIITVSDKGSIGYLTNSEWASLCKL
jgi:hypothetical protein